MRLALNTYVYEVAGWNIEDTLESARRLHFKYVEYAAHRRGNPLPWNREERRSLISRFKDAGLSCCQMLLTDVEHLASSDEQKRRSAMEYMKKVTEFLLELGGRQVLVCWGCGVLETGVMPERSWVFAVEALREYGAWAHESGVLVGLELDPHVYFIVNNTFRMARIIEDVGLPNFFANVDVGHLCITREAPGALEKYRERMIQVHLSETDTYAHTNSILGTGRADFKSYVHKAVELGIEENCRRLKEPCVAGIEMGESSIPVDDPERWVRQSLEYLGRVLPEVTL
ncbi:MAG TPA: sugar phosphate isomerase/epimerase family protein [Methanomassiliicoccales archaeon]|nr:sugar phosphate isomerase/epimerase family protein [Methanomassiliicoccales archaeon]